MSQIEPKTAVKVVMGGMTFGAPGHEGVRVTDLKEIENILYIFQSHGHSELDTARVYGDGTAEEVLGEIGWQKRGIKMETKLYPSAVNFRFREPPPGLDLISHSPEDLRKYLDKSLKALQTDSIDMWYLHAPDRTTPYDVTMKTVNDLYKEGKFKRFGISNFYSWEVAEIVTICKYNGWVQPTAYQGIYNAIHRKVEPELFPCLRKFGISFYAFNPLGGGFFTGRYHSLQESVEPGSRFDPEKTQGQGYRKRYWNETYFRALELIGTAAEKHKLTFAEVALRWISHHSLLKKEHGDAIIIGASSTKHIEQNLIDLEKEPLPEEVVKALDDAWSLVSGVATNYWH
ncbi:Aldo/keto reductase [Irpex rosettiformis]|uniref:Aldo/keto reductase n=1 Tax=Irpex rosettiformis TaxID=378272 RepID=A0ACB8UDR3_9APHY|nr:Aldo/keto reductase [Irpex rosettiformis]